MKGFPRKEKTINRKSAKALFRFFLKFGLFLRNYMAIAIRLKKGGRRIFCGKTV